MPEELPTADSLPVLDSALELSRDPFHFMEQAAESHGPVFRVSIPGLSMVCYTDADLVKRVLVDEADRYRKGSREVEQLGSVLGDGLVTARGETWERGRKHVQPAFYPDRITKYAAEMRKHASTMVDGWDDGDRINIYEASTDFALSVIASTMFGVDDVERMDVIADAAEAITGRYEPTGLPVDIPIWIPTPANTRFRRATSELDAVVEEIIRQRRANGIPENPDDDADLCTALLAGGDAESLSDEEVRDHLLTMLFAGHETTAIALTYTLALLAQHPNEQQRVREEVRDVEQFSMQMALPRTERAIREALRLYPPVYALFRETVEPDTVAGYDIPAGTRVILPQWVIHRSRWYYDEPWAFRPDRWSDGIEESLPEFAYFPFGGGKRQCIGRRFAFEELRIAVATILRTVRLESISETNLEPRAALTCRPDGPVWLRVSERE